MPPPARPRHTRVIAAVAWLVCCVGLAGCGAAASTRATPPVGSPTPTIMPLPTYTPPPTPTPTAFEQQLAQTLQQVLGSLSKSTSVSYNPTAHSVAALVTIAVPGVPNDPTSVAAAQEQGKTICFVAERMLWTSGLTKSLALRAVSVVVVGPIYDQYADLTTGAYAAETLSASLEAHFAWANLTPGAAWDQNDNTFLRPSFNDAS